MQLPPQLVFLGSALCACKSRLPLPSTFIYPLGSQPSLRFQVGPDKWSVTMGGPGGEGAHLQIFILYRAAYFYKEKKKQTNHKTFLTPTKYTVVSVPVFVTFFRDHFSAFLYKIKI